MSKYITEKYRGGLFYVWCGEYFDPRSLGGYSSSSLVAPSSSPKEIYQRLKSEVDNDERHSATITSQKTKFASLAIQWESDGEITKEQKEEIIYIVNNYGIKHWKPFLYIIQRDLIKLDRIELVDASRRASLGDEFIIKDLKSNEFEIVEF